MKLKLSDRWYEMRAKAEEKCMDATAGMSVGELPKKVTTRKTNKAAAAPTTRKRTASSKRRRKRAF